MKAFVLCGADGVEIRALECSAEEMLDTPAEGEQWHQVPRPVSANTVALVDGQIVPVLRMRSPAKALDIAKGAKRVAIQQARDTREFSLFYWDSSAFDADRDSQGRLMGLVSLAQMALATATPFEIDWTLADNTTRTLSAMDALGIGQALGAHVQAAHYTARALKQQVEAATAAEEVDAISWPS